ncbi:MAG TPA: S53 family peptidase, partial [Thermoanaerobaculia bacterium]|nr:S53 family peptidase [Thermoanaerobaculia bacterium]
MRIRAAAVFLLIALLGTALPAAAFPRDDDARVVFPGNVPSEIARAADAGPADPDLPMDRMILVLARRPGAEAEIAALLDSQHDPASPLYHRWLTPAEFGRRFGPSDADLRTLVGWLQDEGFTVDEVAQGRGWIDFSGTAAQVERTFRAPIHDFRLDGEWRHANVADPSVPARLAPLVEGIASLHDFPKRSYRVAPRRLAAESDPGAPGDAEVASGRPWPDYFTFGETCLSPADFAKIYGLEALYRAGIDGTGQKIAIVGRVQITVADVREFRRRFGLPPKDPVVVVNGADPGIWRVDEEQEAVLDVEWSGGVAPGATVILVVSKSTLATDGVDLSAQYVVDHDLAPVVSTSFGACESDMRATNVSFYRNIWQQAAVEGITSFVSSGDTGYAGCDKGGSLSATGGGVNGVASTPYDVAVGGTQFEDAEASLYWSATPDATTGLSAVSYIPESGWNESGAAGGHGLWASGGGASTFHEKPSWQTGPGVPADGRRDVPDISLSAATHDGYFVFQADAGGGSTIGGTSASSPAMAGIMALIDQKAGGRQGNANRAFYPLAAAQATGKGAAVFHDVTTGDNDVPGLDGFDCGSG